MNIGVSGARGQWGSAIVAELARHCDDRIVGVPRIPQNIRGADVVRFADHDQPKPLLVAYADLDPGLTPEVTCAGPATPRDPMNQTHRTSPEPQLWRQAMSSVLTAPSLENEPRMLICAKVLRVLSEMRDEYLMGPVFGLFCRQELQADAMVILVRDQPQQQDYRVLWCELRVPDPIARCLEPAVEVSGAGTQLAELLSDVSPCVRNSWRIAPEDPLEQLLSPFHSLMSLPVYDNGVQIGAVILLRKAGNGFDEDQGPEMICLANFLVRTIQDSHRTARLSARLTAADCELRRLGEVHRQLLAPPPKIAGGRVAVGDQPCGHASGDYYSFFITPNRDVGILLADSSGNGAAGAIAGAVLHGLAHGHTAPQDSPSEFLACLNRQFADLHWSSMFATAVYALYSPANRTIRIASAGHPTARIVSATRGLAGLGPRQGMPLGIRRNETYEETCDVLAPGDRVVLYSDGITETDAMGNNGIPLEVAGLDALLAANALNPPEAIVTSILGRLGPNSARGADAVNADDRTIIVLGVESEGA